MGNNALLQDFALWCRAKGFPRPAEEKVVRQLFAAYMDDRLAQEDIIGQLAEGEPHVENGVLQRPISREGHMLVDDGAGAQIEDERRRDPDDFDELIAHRNQALHEAGGDELAAGAILKAKAITAATSQPALPTGNPPSAADAVLGGSATVNSGDLPVMVANWIGHNDAETGPVSCLFSSVTDFFTSTGRGSATQRGLRPYGVVQFGTRGFLDTAEVDVGGGIQFVVPATQVTLSVALEAPGGVFTGQMTISGMLSFKSVVQGAPPTRTKYIDQLIAGNNSTVQPPRYARRFWVRRSNCALPLVININDSGGVRSQDGNLSINLAPNEVMLEAIPLASQDARITIFNTGALTQQSIAVVFELAF